VEEVVETKVETKVEPRVVVNEVKPEIVKTVLWTKKKEKAPEKVESVHSVDPIVEVKETTADLQDVASNALAVEENKDVEINNEGIPPPVSPMEIHLSDTLSDSVSDHHEESNIVPNDDSVTSTN
jgi:hypothetical protein